MRKQIRLYLILVWSFIAITLGGCGQSVNPPSEENLQADKNAITQLYDDWAAAVESSDRLGYLAVLDEDINMIAPGASDIIGRDAYGKFLLPVFQYATYRIERLGTPQIELMGDYALVRYDYVVHITMAKGVDKITDNQAALDKLVNRAKYLDIVKRQDSGGWKVFRHMWNDAPQDMGAT